MWQSQKSKKVIKRFNRCGQTDLYSWLENWTGAERGKKCQLVNKVQNAKIMSRMVSETDCDSCYLPSWWALFWDIFLIFATTYPFIQMLWQQQSVFFSNFLKSFEIFVFPDFFLPALRLYLHVCSSQVLSSPSKFNAFRVIFTLHFLFLVLFPSTVQSPE